jgi:hypothetical protein
VRLRFLVYVAAIMTHRVDASKPAFASELFVSRQFRSAAQ